MSDDMIRGFAFGVWFAMILDGVVRFVVRKYYRRRRPR